MCFQQVHSNRELSSLSTVHTLHVTPKLRIDNLALSQCISNGNETAIEFTFTERVANGYQTFTPS